MTVRRRRYAAPKGRRTARVVAVAIALAVAGAVQASPTVADDVPSPEAGDDGAGEHVHDHEGDPLAGADLDVLRGEEAVDRLVDSGALAATAAEVGMAPDELVEELLEDPTLALSSDGVLAYIDVLPAETSLPAAAVLAPVPIGVDVGMLSSNPASTRTLFLDFDGHVTSDGVWQSFGAPNPLRSEPFGGCRERAALDAMIFEIWQRVSEDFAPFAINVTTIDPGLDAIVNAGPGDQSWGQRMVVSPTNWIASASAGVLGVAVLGTFGTQVDRPAFVFTDGPSVGTSAKSIAEAISHEAGHTFGLSHDGRTTPPDEYYLGHGVWAPIMGNPTSPARPVTQWSRGEYGAANNREDDVTIIEGRSGRAPDDHPNSAVGAQVLGARSPVGGTIGIGDTDVFLVDVPAPGQLDVTLVPSAPWTNLYAAVRIRSMDGTEVGASNRTAPPNWNARASATGLAPGRYAIEVAPTGYLDAFTGFSTYGSMGRYWLAASTTGAAVTPPPATPAPPLPPASGNCFSAVGPTRLLDTRNGLGATGPVRAGSQVAVQVTGGAVPRGATAAVLNVTVDRTTAGGYVTMHPCEPTVPNTSTLNFFAGEVAANTTIAALSAGGQVCVWVSATTDVIVDITGWLGPAGSSRFTPIGPTRVVDTRNTLGGTRLRPGGVLQVDLSGRVPAGTTAVALNVTSDRAAAPGYLTAYPCGSLPSTSTVNHATGVPRPNNTIVGLTAGRLCIFSFASTDVIVDLTGAFGPSGFRYLPTAPVRVLDTRTPPQRIPPRGATSYSVDAPALGGRQPAAAFVNVTATEHSLPGYVTTYDCGPLPDTSTLNQQVGEDVANGANVPLSGLQSCGWLFGGGHLIVDVNGWWVP